jgi:hypothetical protein
MKTKLLPLALLLCAPAAASAQAQQPATVTVTVPSVLDLDVTGATITFPVPTEADLKAGVIGPTSTTALSHRANVRHSLTVHASSPTMSFSGAAATAKPVGDLEWSLDGTTWRPMTTSPAQVISSAAPGRHDAARTISYRLRLNHATDAPGTYAATLVFAIAGN